MELASVIINSCLSVIAIVISIVTIIKQTKEQKIQNTIQLYDRRINIFCYFMDVYKMSGYLAGYYNFNYKKTFNESFEKVRDNIHAKRLNKDIYSRILNMSFESDKMRHLTMTLFEKELSEFMCELILQFSDYVNILRLVGEGKIEFNKKCYMTFRTLYKLATSYTVDGFDEKMGKYISLVDIKRD